MLKSYCTMMEPHFKGKTTTTKPMYSRKLIHPREYPSCMVKYGACGRENTPQCLVCGIIVQLLLVHTSAEVLRY